MIKKELLEKVYDSAYVQRWNDKFHPVELTELDKQAHKMTIAYLLGKFEESKPGFNWIEIIEAGLFDFLQRLFLTDLKPQLLFTIRQKNPMKYDELNRWVFDKLDPIISPLGQEFCNRYKKYFFNPPSDNLNRRIVEAAHLYASKWEFDFIERANPTGYEIPEISKSFREEVQDYYDLEGIESLALYDDYKNFVEFCGLLRFQFRWGYIYRVPRTSVLGHMLIMAMLSYLFSLEVHACERRCTNNYFTGLFHDLPEVLTRDVISPIKQSIPGLDELIKDYEKEQMRKNPNIEICAMSGGEWIRIQAVAVEDNRVEAKQSMLDAYPNLKSRYSATDDNTQVLYLKDAIATIASFTHDPKVIKF